MNQIKTEPEAFIGIEAQICLICGENAVEHKSDYPSLIKPFAERNVFWCSSCGGGFVRDSTKMLSDFYTLDYAKHNRGDRGVSPEIYFSKKYREKSAKISKYFNRAKRQIGILCDFGVEMNHILDFGSGPGYLLWVSNAKNKYAFEPDTMSEKYLNFIDAKIFSSTDDFSDGVFDAVVASHSVEHLVAEDLIETLERIIRALKPDGRFLIEVPQGGHSNLHLSARQDPHTLFFTPQSIVAAVRRAGGRVLFHKAFAKEPAPLRTNPIYRPEGNAFSRTDRGALTIICERPA